jgi:hypothetical protein
MKEKVKRYLRWFMLWVVSVIGVSSVLKLTGLGPETTGLHWHYSLWLGLMVCLLGRRLRGALVDPKTRKMTW